MAITPMTTLYISHIIGTVPQINAQRRPPDVHDLQFPCLYSFHTSFRFLFLTWLNYYEYQIVSSIFRNNPLFHNPLFKAVIKTPGKYAVTLHPDISSG